MTPTQPYYTVLQLSKIIQASKLDTELSNKWLLPEYSPRKQEVPEDVQPVDLSLKKKPEETGNKTVPPEAENGLYALHEADNSLQAPPEAVNGLHGCDVCGKRYSTSSNLHRHRQVHREVTDRKARACPQCGKVYVSMPAYSMHVRTHTEGCACKICGKSFSRPWLLQGHLRTHTGEKPFKCDKCDKAFADKSNLRAHTQTHSTDKPYECLGCHKSFALKSYLYKHAEASCLRGQRVKL